MWGASSRGSRLRPTSLMMLRMRSRLSLAFFSTGSVLTSSTPDDCREKYILTSFLVGGIGKD